MTGGPVCPTETPPTNVLDSVCCGGGKVEEEFEPPLESRGKLG
jgi:hypothetical protein